MKSMCRAAAACWHNSSKEHRKLQAAAGRSHLDVDLTKQHADRGAQLRGDELVRDNYRTQIQR
eukprot:4876864-Pleurochrysis_carterae.AAC.1